MASKSAKSGLDFQHHSSLRSSHFDTKKWSLHTEVHGSMQLMNDLRSHQI